MKNFVKYIFVAASIATFMMTATPAVEAALTPQEQQQAASLLSSLDSISALLNQFKNSIFGTASAQTAGAILGRIYIDTNGNGTPDSGERFIRDPSGTACTNETVLSGFAVNYSGPSTGSARTDRCNTDPYYLANVPQGTYTLTLGVPSGYTVTAGNGQVMVTVTQGQESHMWFGVKQETLVCTPPATISPADGQTVAGVNNTITVSWAPVSGATSYNIRLNDNTDSSFNSDPAKQAHLITGTGGSVKCTNSPHYICENGIPATITSVSAVPMVAGHNYIFWVDPVGPWANYCNKASTFTVSGGGPYTLTVTKAGNGSGTVTSSPAGINCGSDCSENYALNTTVTLTAAAASGSTFTGWSGDCSGTGTCTLTMSAAKSVTAMFNTTGGATLFVGGPLSLPTTKLVSGANTLYKFQVIAAGGDFALHKMTFSVATTSGVTPFHITLPAFRVYDATDGKYLNISLGTTASFFNNKINYDSSKRLLIKVRTDNITDYANPYVTIPLGQTHVFELRATGSINTNGSSGSVTSNLLGDGAAQTGSVATIEATANNNFIWSAWSSGLTLSSNSWKNGFVDGSGISGLPPSGLGDVTLSATTGTTNTLTVTKAGNGSGTVTSSPAGINCGSDCSENYALNTTVTLTAAAASGSTFTGWNGDCSGTGTCTLTMSAAKSVTAMFNTTGGTNTAPFGFIDLPLGGATVSGTVTVEGWVLDPEDTSILNSRIAFFVGVNPVAMTNVSRYSRPDVCSAYPNVAHCATSNPGVRFDWNTSTLTTAGSHSIGLSVTDSGTPNITTNDIGTRVVNVTGIGGTGDTQPPSQPTNLQVTGITSNTVSLSWSASTDNVQVTGYKIYRCQGASCTPTTQIATTPTLLYTSTGLSADTAYWFAVAAYDAVGNTSPQAAILVRTPATGGGDTTPPIISNVTASSITSSGATITWTTNEASDSQVEYGQTTSYGQSTTLADTDPRVLSHSQTISGLSASTLYHYRVKSKDASLNLATSNDYTFTTITTGGDGTTPALQNNDSVRTSVRLKIRSGPLTSAATRPSSPAEAGATGRINCSATPPAGVTVPVDGQNCPTVFQGAVWWYVDYDTEDDGWSAEQFGESEGLLVKRHAITPGYQIDDRINAVVDGLNIRSSPSLDSSVSILGQAFVSPNLGGPDTGIVVAPPPSYTYPVSVDNIVWWYIDWDDPSLPTGWSAEKAAGTTFIVKSGGGGEGIAVQLFMDPDGPKTAAEGGVDCSATPVACQGTVKSKLFTVSTGSGLNEVLLDGRINIAIENGGEMIAYLKWQAPAGASCTLRENFPSIIPPVGNPVSFSFPLTGTGNTEIATFVISKTGLAPPNVGVNTPFVLNCGSSGSATVTASYDTFGRAGDNITLNDVLAARYTLLASKSGSPVKVDLKAAIAGSYQSGYAFNDGPGNPLECRPAIDGTSVCESVVFWSAMNATSCSITKAGPGFPANTDSREAGTFALHRDGDKHSKNITVTCRNSSGNTSSDSVTIQ